MLITSIITDTIGRHTFHYQLIIKIILKIPQKSESFI